VISNSVYIFGAVALFMLLIACINFMNLSTAGATKRSKEVGVKKVLGSQKNQLVHQFLIESFISTAVAMILACADCNCFLITIQSTFR
jgi:putative ABC transport system permease protein